MWHDTGNVTQHRKCDMTQEMRGGRKCLCDRFDFNVKCGNVQMRMFNKGPFWRVHVWNLVLLQVLQSCFIRLSPKLHQYKLQSLICNFWWVRKNPYNFENDCSTLAMETCTVWWIHHELTHKVLVATIDAQWEGMGDVGSARYEPALLPPCPTIRVLSYSNL